MFEGVARKLVRYLDPDTYYRSLHAKEARATALAKHEEQQQASREFASTLYRVLYYKSGSCFSTLVLGRVPSFEPDEMSIYLITEWVPYFENHPPKSEMERARIRIFDSETDPRQPQETPSGTVYPSPFLELTLNRIGEGWSVREEDYRLKSWPPKRREIEKDPYYIYRWNDRAVSWRKVL